MKKKAIQLDWHYSDESFDGQVTRVAVCPGGVLVHLWPIEAVAFIPGGTIKNWLITETRSSEERQFNVHESATE